MSAETVEDHLDDLRATLDGVRAQAGRFDAWGRELAARLTRGHRLLAAGNGGSAAEAQHLTAELVGRYRGEREPLSALALHADTSALTALGNDYGFAEVFARQVRAHGRPGDVLMLLSTSGRSENLLAAAEAARPLGVVVWCLTGPAPNPLASCGDDAICLPGPAPTVQEAQLVAVHLLCEVVDRELAHRPATGSSGLGSPGGARGTETGSPGLGSWRGAGCVETGSPGLGSSGDVRGAETASSGLGSSNDVRTPGTGSGVLGPSGDARAADTGSGVPGSSADVRMAGSAGLGSEGEVLAR